MTGLTHTLGAWNNYPKPLAREPKWFPCLYVVLLNGRSPARYFIMSALGHITEAYSLPGWGLIPL